MVPLLSTDVSSSQPQSRVVVTVQQTIDETNEEVKTLLNADMGTVEMCIRAIEMYGTADIAFRHMIEQEEAGTLMQPLPVFDDSTLQNTSEEAISRCDLNL